MNEEIVSVPHNHICRCVWLVRCELLQLEEKKDIWGKKRHNSYSLQLRLWLHLINLFLPTSTLVIFSPDGLFFLIPFVYILLWFLCHKHWRLHFQISVFTLSLPSKGNSDTFHLKKNITQKHTHEFTLLPIVQWKKLQGNTCKQLR